MVWAVHVPAMCWPLSGLFIAWAGHGLVWADHWLGCRLRMNGLKKCAGHSLSGRGFAGHVLGWAEHALVWEWPA
jgi:hypothetical protein